jgi:tRNA threonylcarbamoyladenosine biosynthesis protein TsaE
MGENRYTCASSEATFELGKAIAGNLAAGDAVLLYGGLGAGKTLLTKGILSGLDFDIDEVTSPSFALVNLYRTEKFDVYHIDLWRVEGPNAADTVGLDEIVEMASTVTIIEWAERLVEHDFTGRVIRVEISGEGDEPRNITVRKADS